MGHRRKPTPARCKKGGGISDPWLGAIHFSGTVLFSYKKGAGNSRYKK